jgi:DNA-directed RNA polymerase sigma subunit (sigma70/sigma32)
MTYAKIGRILGISKQRLMQLERAALKKLRVRLAGVRREIA